jgi:hypothetical protein
MSRRAAGSNRLQQQQKGAPMPEQYREAVDLAERTASFGPDHAADGDLGIVRANDQFARDIAEIERATAALRRAEPSLEMWSEIGSDARTDDAATLTIRKTRPVWLLIGLLWLSTALVTVGAVAAIARLVG